MVPHKTLFIVRHGKSSWDQFGIADIDRPLKEKGIKNSYEIAETIKKRKLSPEIVYTSPAARALNTAIIFSRVLDLPQELILLRNDLYLAEVEDILEVIHQTSPDVNSVMIFGHNPGFTDLANHLSELRLANLPTAGLVTLQFSAKDWKGIQRSNLVSSLCEFPGDA